MESNISGKIQFDHKQVSVWVYANPPAAPTTSNPRNGKNGKSRFPELMVPNFCITFYMPIRIIIPYPIAISEYPRRPLRHPLCIICWHAVFFLQVLESHLIYLTTEYKNSSPHFKKPQNFQVHPIRSRCMYIMVYVSTYAPWNHF